MSAPGTSGPVADAAPPRRRGIRGVFYGWWIVAGATVASMLQSALYYNGFGVFFLPILRDFQASSVQVSGAVSLARLETGVLGPAGGFLVDRLGPRRVMVVGIGLMGGAFILLSRLHSLPLFYAVFLVIAVGASLGFGNATMTAVGNWFVRRRSLAFGIVVSGVGLGGPLTAAMGWLIGIHGWRAAAVVAGLLIWAVGFPIAAIMRHRPEDHGLLPDGRAPDAGSSGSQMAGPEEGDFTARQALRTYAFWLMSVSFSLRVLVTGAVGIHLVPYVVTLGISEAMGALLLGAIAVLSMAGRLGFGVIGDLFPKRYVVAAGTAALLASCLIAATATSLWQVMLFVVLYSPAYGGLAMMMHSMRGEYFGRRSFGTIQGFMGTVMMFGTMLGPIYAAWIFDTTGLYRIAFFSFAAILAVATAAILLVRRPSPVST